MSLRQNYSYKNYRLNYSLQYNDLKPFLKTPHPERIKIFSTIDSTNTALKKAASQGAPHLQVFIASHQKVGRGRMGRQFFSPENTGVYLSVLYYAGKNPYLIRFLTMAASVAVHNAIKSVFDIDTQLKWVNDIYLKDKKIGGILAESVLSAADPKKNYIVLGIGLNLFEPEHGFPEELNSIAGSLLPKEKVCDQTQYSKFIAALIENLWTLGDVTDPKDYIDIYRRHSYVINKKVILYIGKETVIGTVKDFNDYGHLIIVDENNIEKTISSGEISLRLI